MLIKSSLNWLKLPEVSQLRNLDDPENIYIIRQIIKRKPFLYKIYRSFYRELLNKTSHAPSNGLFIELGSGASSLKKIAPYVVTSDVLPYDGVDEVFSALEMPFQDASVSAFMLVDVLHHLKDARQFFKEAQRCLKLGGKIVMIEPANTLWSKLIYTNFHHEPFDARGEWGFEEGGPLSGANMAIPWIIFFRDKSRFADEFPDLAVCSIRIHTPFRYLLSGGLSMRQLLPSQAYFLIQFLEWVASPLNKHIGLFMTIDLQKISMS